MKQYCYILLLVLAPATAVASISVEPYVVQQGIYQRANCIPDINSKTNECLCKGKAIRPIVKGISDKAANKIASYFEKDIADSDNTFRPLCPGEKVNTREKPSQWSKYDFEVGTIKEPFLSFTVSYGHYRSGMNRPFTTRYYTLFNTETGEFFTYRDIFGDDLSQLNHAISKQVMALYPDSQEPDWAENIANDPDNVWIGKDMLDANATIALTDEGLMLNLMLGPRIRGTTKIVIDNKLIKNNAIKKVVESAHAGR